jgi:hypothetical protein
MCLDMGKDRKKKTSVFHGLSHETMQFHHLSPLRSHLRSHLPR